MAHTLCANKHSMWNGDGRVCVEAYPVEFVKQISEENPDRKFGDKDNDYSLLVDMYDSCPEKEPDIWRCTECLSLVIFFSDSKYGIEKCYGYVVDEMENLPDKTLYSKWEEYFVENNDAFEEHHENLKNQGLTPYESFERFHKESDKLNFAYVSDDKLKIVVTDNSYNPIRLYKLKWKTE